MIRLDNISKQNSHQIVFIEASAALQEMMDGDVGALSGASHA